MQRRTTCWWSDKDCGTCNWVWEIVVRSDSSRSCRPTTSSSFARSVLRDRYISFCPSRIIFSSRTSGCSNWTPHNGSSEQSEFPIKVHFWWSLLLLLTVHSAHKKGGSQLITCRPVPKSTRSHVNPSASQLVRVKISFRVTVSIRLWPVVYC